VRGDWTSRGASLPPFLPFGRRHECDAGLRPESHLTNSGREVLTWVGRGKTSLEIAIVFSLRDRMETFHCDRAMRRLDVVNRTQAVAKAVAQGLIAI
jgi:DNA-binding CsgD family transcriptional regulator